MSWMIDRDYLAAEMDDQSSNVGRGQYDSDSPPDMPHLFRLRDDDGEVYYGGRYDDGALENDEEYGGLYQAFRWGAYDAGSSDLQIRNGNGSWESVYG
jgi:hypothetical protein